MINSQILFEPIGHTYTHIKKQKIYTPVTRVIAEYEEEFNEQDISLAISLQSNSRKKEKYIGLSQEDILNNWKHENKIANDYGHKIHNLLETYLKRDRFYFPKDDEEREILNAYDDLKIDLGVKYYCERILSNDEYEVAGMTDHIVDFDDDLFDVNDYKSNKVLNTYSLYKKKLHYPLDFLDHCQYNTYAIQLGIYAYFYEQETGKKCRSLRLLYYDRNQKKFIVYNVPYMKLEVLALLNHFKKHGKIN